MYIYIYNLLLHNLYIYINIFVFIGESTGVDIKRERVYLRYFSNKYEIFPEYRTCYTNRSRSSLFIRIHISNTFRKCFSRYGE